MIHRRKTLGRTIGFILIILFLIGIIAVCGALLWYKNSLTAINKTHCTDDCKYTSFAIADGATTASVAESLEEQGIIKSAFAFRLYLKLEARDAILHSGNYDISDRLSVSELVKMFNDGVQAPTFRITFLPGGTIMDAKKRLAEKGYKQADIEAAFAKKYNHPVMKDMPENGSIEGYIYGETYEFYTSATVEEILTRTFDELQRVVESENLASKFKAQGLSLYEGITLASVVQRESGTIPGDMPHVAQVFLLRLSKGIPLGSDAVIAYRADQLTENRDKTDMSYLNSVKCPWNSRQCAGLPPTPISSPGKGALQAVANPTDTDDLYFLTGDDMKMYYAHTEAEHNANAKQYCKKLCGYL